MYLRSKGPLHLSIDTDHEEVKADNQADQNINAEDLLKLMDDLPPGYRAVFNLYAIEGYGHKEIGEMLGISEGASKSQLSKARATLQKKLAGLEAYAA
jgi:RNA polymerase sigma factor (sigma-70 family)